MYCLNCGKQLPDNAGFCMNCGTKTGQANQPNNIISVKKQISSKIFFIFSAVSAIISAIGFGIGLYISETAPAGAVLYMSEEYGDYAEAARIRALYEKEEIATTCMIIFAVITGILLAVGIAVYIKNKKNEHSNR